MMSKCTTCDYDYCDEKVDPDKVCHVASPGCMAGETKAKCFACGLPTCPQCSLRIKYYTWGRVRLCHNCLEDFKGDAGRELVLQHEYRKAGYASWRELGKRCVLLTRRKEEREMGKIKAWITVEPDFDTLDGKCDKCRKRVIRPDGYRVIVRTNKAIAGENDNCWIYGVQVVYRNTKKEALVSAKEVQSIMRDAPIQVITPAQKRRWTKEVRFGDKKYRLGQPS